MKFVFWVLKSSILSMNFFYLHCQNGMRHTEARAHASVLGHFSIIIMLCQWKREIRAMSEDVCIFGPELMMPFRAEQEHAKPTDDLRAIYPLARCVHWWAGSWWNTEQEIMLGQSNIVI